MISCYKLKLKYNAVYDGLTPSKTSKALENNIVSVFLNRDQLGRRIILQRMGGVWDPKKVPLLNVNQSMALFFYALMFEPDTQINGLVGVIDVKGMNISHVTAYSPSEAKMIATVMGKGVPLRIKAIHYINAPKIFKLAFAICGQFFNEKLRSRIYIHGTDMTSLHKHIAPECLPSEYGGTSQMPCPSGEDWKKLFVLYENEFKLQNSWGFTKSPKK